MRRSAAHPRIDGRGGIDQAMESSRTAILRLRTYCVLMIVFLSIVLAACSAAPKETASTTPSAQTQQAPSSPPAASPAVATPSSTTTPEPTSITVYVTKTGEKYHRDGCRYLSQSKIQISLKDAKARGYDPCSVCKPQT